MTTSSEPIRFDQKPNSRFHGLMQGRTRIAAAWIFGIWLAASARTVPSGLSSLLGMTVCFLGAALRYWASGFLRKDSRPAVGGPYAWVRNPLYLGTYLMAVGTAWTAQSYVLALVVSILFAVVYHYIILDEENKLRHIFGAPYLKYCELVPRFFPRVWRASQNELTKVNPDLTHHGFAWDLAKKNKAYESFATFTALIGGVYLMAYVWGLVL